MVAETKLGSARLVLSSSSTHSIKSDHCDVKGRIAFNLGSLTDNN